jgi:tetratricopeptide (TPR) repeat protein
VVVPLSVIVVAYDIARELPRTLLSLAVGYQRGVTADHYEVIVVDNGSPTPVDESVFAGLDGRFRLLRIDDASPSPAPAVNRGLREARGETIGVLVDGARLVTPGFVMSALFGSRIHRHSCVVTLGWYLGYDFQRYALAAGWTQSDEDALLEQIGWPDDGYRLFEISTMDESSVNGWFFEIFESNGLFLPAGVWDELGGFDERFDVPGGGLANHDLLRRAAGLEHVGFVVPLAEGTFHQLHGGIATNAAPSKIEADILEWRAQYAALRGCEADGVVLSDPVLLGPVPPGLRPRLVYALNTKLYAEMGLDPPLPPQVRYPEPDAEPDALARAWLEQARDAAGLGHDAEAEAFARRARVAASASSETWELLSFIANGKQISDVSLARRVQFYVDAGDACARGGDHESAAAHYLEALRLDPGNLGACHGQRRLEMPGPGYLDRLRRVHELLNPATYLEIGVSSGDSLALARPPTVAVAIDPYPKVEKSIGVECHLYRETSTEFFTQRDVRDLFGGAGPALVFIDGLHEFPAALEDFANVEAISDPGTVVVLHDMIPFDELTQRPEGFYEFYTGDVWKLLRCLAEVRPDLSWFTVRTPPSGLTFVTGLDAGSTVLRDRHDELVTRYGALPFDKVLDTPGAVIDNDWRLIEERLSARQDAPSAVRRGERRRATARVVPPHSEALARRVRDLEELDARRRKELADTRRIAQRGAFAWTLDPESAYAELERIRQTKLHRWTRPLRRLYSRVRYHRDVI